MMDWMRICSDLRTLFGSLNQVARLLHYENPEYLGKLQRGEISDPRYSLGVRLVELYEKYIDKAPVVGHLQQRKLI